MQRIPTLGKKFFSLLKDLAKKKPSSRNGYALDRPHDGSDDKSSGKRQASLLVSRCRSNRPLPDDSPLWLLRDELYYIACARHLDFGYVDLAPLSAFLLRID